MIHAYINTADLTAAIYVLENMIGRDSYGSLGYDRTPSDLDSLARVVEVQLHMDIIMKRIRWVKSRLDAAKAGDYLPKPIFMGYVQEQKKLWSMWNRGKDACKEAVNGDKGLWSWFFNLENREEFLADYLSIGFNRYWTNAKDEEVSVDKNGMPITDNRHEETDIQFAENYDGNTWNGHWMHDCLDNRVRDFYVDLPDRDGGYVPPCRDVTYVYGTTDDGEWESIMASCPF